MITLHWTWILFAFIELIYVIAFLWFYPKTSHDFEGWLINVAITILNLFLIAFFGGIYWW